MISFIIVQNQRKYQHGGLEPIGSSQELLQTHSLDQNLNKEFLRNVSLSMKLISFNKILQVIKIYEEIRNIIKMLINDHDIFLLMYLVYFVSFWCLIWAKTWTLPALPVASDPLGKVAENSFDCSQNSLPLFPNCCICKFRSPKWRTIGLDISKYKMVVKVD